MLLASTLSLRSVLTHGAHEGLVLNHYRPYPTTVEDNPTAAVGRSVPISASAKQSARVIMTPWLCLKSRIS